MDLVLQQYPLKEIFGIFAGGISLLAYVFYIVAILKKTTKPSRSSWWIWTLIGLVIVLSYHAVGATYTIWVPVSFFIGPLIIAILSIWHGEGTGLETLDKVCLLGSIIGILLWVLFDSAEIALFINIFVDLLGYIPTLKKTQKNPLSESKITWIIFTTGSILNLMAIEDWVLHISIYPIYMFIMDIIMLLLIYKIYKSK